MAEFLKARWVCTRTDACSRMLHWWQGDEHSDGEGAAVVATTRHSLAAAVLLLFYLCLFCLMVRYSCGTVRHDLAMRGATAAIQAAGETTSWTSVRQRSQTRAGGSDQSKIAEAWLDIGLDPVRPTSPGYG